MKLYYDYGDIKNLILELSCQIDRINNNSFASKNMEELANEIDKLLIYYNEVLLKLKPEEKITDFQMVQAFNETTIIIKIFNAKKFS